MIRGISSGSSVPYKVHFVGVGGIGMSGLAEILLNLDYRVSGSDAQLSTITQRLESLGAEIFEGHRAENIRGAGILVVSAAIPPDNPEVLAAREMDIPVIPRSQMLSDLMRLKPNAIAVGGTHGKTTTTSMIAAVLEKAEVESTAIIGGILNRKGSNVAWGRGDYLVAEADEHDGSFLRLSPTVAVVTNIDAEHLEYYGTIDEIKKAFVDFVNRIPFYGFSVLCVDDPNTRDILPQVKVRHVTYGIDDSTTDFGNHIPHILGREIRVSVPHHDNTHPLDMKGLETSFEVVNNNEALGYKGSWGRVRVRSVGRHNVLNALAAISVALGLGMPFARIREGLLLYEGVGRRLQMKGSVNGITVMEDYGHHPTEVTATLRAIKELQFKRLIVVFQPHLYSRTKFFTEDFARAFLPANKAILTAIYGAREKPMEGVSSVNIVRSARQMGHADVEYIENKNDIPAFLEKQLQSGDLVLFLGAGDIWKTADAMVERLKRQ